MLNSIGLQGPGIHAFVDKDLPWLKSVGARVLVSIAGNTAGEFADVARVLADSDAFDCVVGVEVNISCPNVANRGLVFACDPLASGKVIALVREQLPRDVPMFAKLTPDVTDIVSIADAAVKSGATGLTMINTLLGMVIDTDRLRPQLGGITGGLSGPSIRPVAVRALWQVTAAMRDGRFQTVPAHRGRGSAHRTRRPRAHRRRRHRRPGRHRDLQRPDRTPARPHRARGARRVPRRRPHHRARRGRPRQDGDPVTRTRHRPPTFGQRLREPRRAEHGPLCAGIDPHRALVESWGLTYDLDGLRAFTDACVEAFAGHVAVVKPQSAFFEVFGSGGCRGPRGRDPRPARRGHARPARRQARRHRLDDGRVRRGLPRRLGASSPADALTVSPYLGLRVAAARPRHRRRQRPRRVRPRPHLEPRGRVGAARAPRRA